MLFATGLAVLPAWLIWTSRIGEPATQSQNRTDMRQRTKGERHG
jgi:hypothetical protein